MNLGIREGDAIRQIPELIKAQGIEIQELRADNRIMKELLRSIKKAVVRKYGEVKGEELTELAQES